MAKDDKNKKDDKDKAVSGKETKPKSKGKNKKTTEKVVKEIIIEKATIKEWAQAVGIIGILILFVFLLLTFKSSIKTKKHVMFDLKGTYKTFFHQAYRQHLTRTQIKFLGKEFPIAVDYAIKHYAVKNKAIVFNKSAVIYGMKDATAEIQKGIGKEMQRLAQKRK